MLKYEVLENKPLTSTTLLLTLKHQPGGRRLSFQPGQYIAVNFYNGRRPTAVRCFSIVSSPEQSTIQLCPRVKGRFTNYIKKLQPGDPVDVRGAFGGFVIEPDTQKDVVLIAGGIGIAPFISMLRNADKLKSDTNFHLIYSCQTQDDVPFADELIHLHKTNPNFKVTFVITKGSTEKLGDAVVATGRINEEILSKAKGHSAHQTFFICGPPAFMKAVGKMLGGLGVSKDKIMTEAFSQGPSKQTGKIRSWPVNIYILTSAGIMLGGVTVMVTDLLHTLPALKKTASNTPIANHALTNKRQQDIDDAVNGLPPTVQSTKQKTTTRTVQTPSSSSGGTSTPTPAPSPPPTTRVS